MEKPLALLGYWLGVICTVLAVIFRLFAVFNMTQSHFGPSAGIAISYESFLHGAALFFLLSIASWCRTARS